MSRAFRISVADSVRRQVEVEDGLQACLQLLPILAPERMKQIFTAVLIDSGFVVNGALAIQQLPHDVVIEIDLDKLEVKILMRKSTHIEVKHELCERVEEEKIEQRQTELSQALADKIEQSFEQQADMARQDLSAKLKPQIAQIQTALDQIINLTLATALKEKAAQLGEIEDITETEAGELSIRIKV